MTETMMRLILLIDAHTGIVPNGSREAMDRLIKTMEDDPVLAYNTLELLRKVERFERMRASVARREQFETRRVQVEEMQRCYYIFTEDLLRDPITHRSITVPRCFVCPAE